MLKGKIELQGDTKEDILYALKRAVRQIKKGFYGDSSGTNASGTYQFHIKIKDNT